MPDATAAPVQEGAEESGEDPDSPGPIPFLRSKEPQDPPPDPLVDSLQVPLAYLGGVLIALLTVLVPLATVVGDRRGLPSGDSPTLPAFLPDGPSASGPVPGTGSGERAGGDSRRQHE